MTDPTALYRMYDTRGRLLYVGITGRLPDRLGQHQDGKPWWVEVESIRVEHFETREEASIAEITAIVNEGPEYNVAHAVNGGTPSFYVIDVGKEHDPCPVCDRILLGGRTLLECVFDGHGIPYRIINGRAQQVD